MNKKICFFTTFYDFTRQRAVEYFERILPKDIESFLFCSQEAGDKFKTKRMKKIFYNNKYLAVFSLRKFCKKNKIDVITNLGGTYNSLFTMLFSTILLKTKAIFYLRGNIKLNPFLFISQFFTSKFLIASKEISEKIKNVLIFNKNKVFYSPNEIDIHLFKPKNKATCRKILKKLRISQRDKIIIYVGRIEILKGSDILLKMIKSNPDKKFILIGKLIDKNYNRKELANLIHIPQIDIDELTDYYSTADLCLFLSRIEGFGRVPREAMSCGLPTIVSDIEALREISPPAIKVSFDMKIIQRKIDKFFSLSGKERKKISIESRKFIVREYSGKKLEEKHLKYLLC